MLAREDDYEVSLPRDWTKQQLPDDSWILTSTETSETLRVRALVPESGVVNDSQVAAMAAAAGLRGEMTSHTELRSEWIGASYSVTGTGRSLPHGSALAYRVLADGKRVVWALHERSIEEQSSALDERAVAIVGSLKLR